VPTRAGIEGKLAKERAALLERYERLSSDELAAACTESEHDGGAPWSAKDHLAHLADIERTFQGIVERTIAGDDKPVDLGAASGSSPTDVMATVHRRNQAHVDAHRAADLETVLADIAAARADTLRLLDSLSDAELALPVPGAPWADGTVAGVLITLGYHDQQHRQWVEKGLAGDDR
jgi:hypothetical protein